MRRINVLLIAVVALIIPLQLSASGKYVQERDTVRFHFESAPLSVNSELTSERFDSLVNYIKAIDTSHNDTIHVTIIGSASPEGRAVDNLKLATRRADALHEQLSSRITGRNVVYTMKYVGDNWDGLKSLVANSDISDKETILGFFDLPLETRKAGQVVDSRKRRMMLYKNGEMWNELSLRFFHYLRSTDVLLDYVVHHPDKTSEEAVLRPYIAPDLEDDEVVVAEQLQPTVGDAASGTVVTEVSENIGAQLASTAQTATGGHKFLIALKTNMLYDLVAVPNIGVELPLPAKFSVGANWMYAWWKSDNRHRYWRTYGGNVYARKWFGHKSILSGHHLGVYGQIVTYDFEWGHRGYLGDRWSYAAGVEYGYSVKIAKRFNIDFSLGVGYLWGEYKEYIPDAGRYVWQATKQRKWIGPTNAEISLVWLIGNVH
jgi:hypothetical protein